MRPRLRAWASGCENGFRSRTPTPRSKLAKLELRPPIFAGFFRSVPWGVGPYWGGYRMECSRVLDKSSTTNQYISVLYDIFTLGLFHFRPQRKWDELYVLIIIISHTRLGSQPKPADPSHQTITSSSFQKKTNKQNKYENTQQLPLPGSFFNLHRRRCLRYSLQQLHIFGPP